MPASVRALMLALKLANLAQGASVVRRTTIAMLEAMLATIWCQSCLAKAPLERREIWRRSRIWRRP